MWMPRLLSSTYWKQNLKVTCYKLKCNVKAEQHTTLYRAKFPILDTNLKITGTSTSISNPSEHFQLSQHSTYSTSARQCTPHGFQCIFARSFLISQEMFNPLQFTRNLQPFQYWFHNWNPVVSPSRNQNHQSFTPFPQWTFLSPHKAYRKTFKNSLTRNPPILQGVTLPTTTF